MLAVALGIDCMVVSFSQGLVLRANRMKTSLALAVTMEYTKLKKDTSSMEKSKLRCWTLTL